jgi:hypothetical protein
VIFRRANYLIFHVQVEDLSHVTEQLLDRLGFDRAARVELVPGVNQVANPVVFNPPIAI